MRHRCLTQHPRMSMNWFLACRAIRYGDAKQEFIIANFGPGYDKKKATNMRGHRPAHVVQKMSSSLRATSLARCFTQNSFEKARNADMSTLEYVYEKVPKTKQLGKVRSECDGLMSRSRTTKTHCTHRGWLPWTTTTPTNQTC